MVQQPQQIPSRPFAEVKQEAVAAALEGQWEQAAELNHEAISISPQDAGSYNRLATALTELGRFTQAREAAEHALELAPDNKIAQKHVDRLSQLDGQVASAPTASGARAATRFITDPAKTTVTELNKPADARVLATVAPGQVLFHQDNGVRMDLHTRAGERIGTLDVHMAQRLRRLFEGGNEYEFTVAKLSTVAIAVLVAETKLSASMTKVVSFPPSLQKSAADFDLDDELMEDAGDELEMMEHEDDETVTPEAERSERIKSIMSGRLGGAYGLENEGLSI